MRAEFFLLSPCFFIHSQKMILRTTSRNHCRQTCRISTAGFRPSLRANVICERVKTEQEAFERFASIYHDEESIPYKPSPGLLRLMAHRRQLLDFEFTRSSPPSISGTLHGIYKITAA